VLTGGAREAGQVGSYCQPQPVSERRQRMRGTEASSVKVIML
jgi:hypothetical protein